ncbi:MAG TPA: hypothetical protein VMM12_00150 [Longimicrobiales bacterium]|nr:hypothetical protein [Longimicrobiales bacterium]
MALGAAAALLGIPARSIGPATPSMPLQTGTDSALVLIVSSQCSVCSDPALVEQLGALLRKAQVASAGRLKVIGIAVDPSPRDGYELLSRMGRFDEMNVGGGWSNLAFSDLLWGDSIAVWAVPQLVVLERQLDADGRTVVEKKREVQVAAMGARDVVSWLQEYLSSSEQ